MDFWTFIFKKLLILIHNEKKLSSNCAKRRGTKKNFNSKLLKLYEYVQSISLSTQLS